MLTEVKNNYNFILKHFSFNKLVSSADYNKHKLIYTAKNGEPRPSQKTKIGRYLSEYTKKSSYCFDINFYKEISTIRPDWFVSQTEAANQKKQELIRMAKNGEPRPSHDKTKLGQALSNYTRKSSPVYDAKFDELMRELSPDWFDLSLLLRNNAHRSKK